MSDNWTDERTKMLIDLLDENYGRAEIGDMLGVTKNVINGQCTRHNYRQGHAIIATLAKQFPDATAREIAEATARDKAIQILYAVGDERETGGPIRESVVAKMRAHLQREAA